jgi:hypothetical protein
MPLFEIYIKDMADTAPLTNHNVESIRQKQLRSCKSGRELDNKF